MFRFFIFAPVALMLAAVPDRSLGREPASILKDTIAENTYVEVEKAAQDGAIALWGLGSIEEHGPHLPLGTDVYVASAQLRAVRKILKGASVDSVIVPPYYWAVNHVTGDFAGSFNIRPEIMTELMLDVFTGLAKAGFKDVYCITGHFDAAHGRAIAEAVRRANETGLIHAHFVVPRRLGKRLELDTKDGRFVVVEWPKGAAMPFADLHAGADETSAMLEIAPHTVKKRMVKNLPDRVLSNAQIADWRKGGASARLLTPDGYLGAPSRSSRKEGRRQLREQSRAYAAAILAAERATTGVSPR